MAVGMQVFMAKLRQFIRPARVNVELKDEIELHIQMLKERFISRGMKPEDAETAAHRQFGNATLLRERHHELRTFSVLATSTRDVHFGLRQLRRNPTLTFVAIASLALGIGANTAIFTAAKRVLLDTLPVANPNQLRMLTWVSGHEQTVPPVWGDVQANAPSPTRQAC